jgi:MYXO-CTERM domain-containing protein
VTLNNITTAVPEPATAALLAAALLPLVRRRPI